MTTSDPAFLAKMTDKITSSEHCGPKFRVNGVYLSGITCPECGKAEAWAYTKAPWTIICNRQNHCGARIKTLDLFPDLRRNIEEDFKPTQQDPNHPATAFLQSRGLNNSLEGLTYRYQQNIRRTGSGGVMFKVGEGCENGRLFNPPPGEGKTHNMGKSGGQFWQHPGLDYDPDHETFVTEGIIDALSLIEMGHQAIAVLTAGQNPNNLDLSEFKNLTLAFDPDEAGQRALKKWRAAYPEADAIMPERGDWNDFLLAGQNSEDRFGKSRPKFELQANLALAETADDYVNFYIEFHSRVPGLFPFNQCYYWSFMKAGSETKPPELFISCVSNFTLSVDHYQLDMTNPEEPNNRFFLKIKPRRGRMVSCSVSAPDLATPGGLTTMFIQRARVLWEGDKHASTALARLILEAQAPVIRQLKTTGYDLDSNCYIFQSFMIDRKGSFSLPNKKGFFNASHSNGLRPAQHATIKPKQGVTPADVWNLIHQAWGDNGVAAIAWITACWWVNQIKAEMGFFPFLSLWGDTQTGKSRLARTLNAMQGLDEEGLPMNKVNTGKGEIRKLAQRSGLFKALLEANNTERARFDFESILPLYNAGNPLQVSALKSGDIQTRETPFLSSLMFVQNKEPFKTRAQKERVISLHFSKNDLTDSTFMAFNRLIRVPITELSWFFVHVMQQRERIEKEMFPAIKRAQADLLQAIPDNRINENYAILLAFHRLLLPIIGINHDLLPFVQQIGAQKITECSRRQESVADHFFNLLIELDFKGDTNPCLKIEEKEGRMYVNLPLALKQIKDKGHQINVQLEALQVSLRDHPSFMFSNVRTYFQMLNGPTRKRAWVFDLAKTLS